MGVHRHNRRHFLRGMATALPLPWMPSLVWSDDREAAAQKPPQRLFCMYIPYGTCTPVDKPDYDIFPTGEGEQFTFSSILNSWEVFKKRTSIFKYHSHVTARRINGHFAADSWLTAADLRRGYDQQISIDQLVAEKIGLHTRYPSLVMSSEGGTGLRCATRTLSFDRNGNPIPALNKPRLIFNRLFSPPSGQSLAQQRMQMQEGRSILDTVLESSQRLNKQLDRQDQRKLDAYMGSVREVERRLGVAEQWLDKPKPQIDASELDLDIDPKVPTSYVDTMLHLAALALQTDSTRVVTYQLGSEQADVSGHFPRAAGVKEHGHNVGHGGQERGLWDDYRKYETWRSERLAGFVRRLMACDVGDGDLLDHTMVLYGGGSSSPHDQVNLPTFLIGGEKIGLRQGRYYVPKTPAGTGLELTARGHLHFNPAREQPLCKVWRTMLDCFGIEAPHLDQSSGIIKELRA